MMAMLGEASTGITQVATAQQQQQQQRKQKWREQRQRQQHSSSNNSALLSSLLPWKEKEDGYYENITDIVVD